MTQKRYTIAEKIEFCKKAIEAQKEDISFYKSSKILGISDVSLYLWVKMYRAGELIDKSKKEIEIPNSLVLDMTEEFNSIGSVKIEMVDVLVFSESIENNIRVSVEKPDTNDIEKFSDELNQRILDKLQWCFVVRGFKF